MEYERLLEIARKMHCWIFLHTFDEDEVYEELGLTPEENAILGSAGKIEIQIPKEENVKCIYLFCCLLAS